MSRYFVSVLVFMAVFCINGIIFEGFESENGVVVTTFLSLICAVVAYVVVPNSKK